ncbi:MULTISPECIES: transcriptional repressor [unclassified Caballeronia]|uniref:Fur family transcriptional regulator n=1 Tax=unclassified Caballeronia TaxID=2646786 RepID=UPI00285C7227|nr:MULTISPECIES: transcriptional repressor [unclassified Caballeronia]MDR5777406.1 transcriptional repressor [Caballeronia sp. LZ002]MDR5852850.1 transcriptional repressor [Caballeronia sp. LZ003]
MRTDHDPALIERLECRLVATGQKATRLRRQVLSLLLRRGGHASAYELINDLPSIGRTPSPPAVYRALDFLIEIGLVVRLSATNTFMVLPLKVEGQGHAVFLICTKCHAIEMLAGIEVERTLFNAAQGARYRLAGGHTEVNGVCSACQAKSGA